MLNNNSHITFQAKFINNTHILKRSSENIFRPLKTSFVEINTTNPNDVQVLNKIEQWWDNSFAENISYLANNICQGKLSKNDFGIYALTKQSENFNCLEDADILGLVETELKSKNRVHINYLQVDPEQVYKIKPAYNKIGSRILDSLKELYEVITLRPNSKGTEKFYEKNDFHPTKEDSKTYIWTKE